MNTKRIIIAVFASAGLAWAIWQAESTGRARTLGEDADQTNDAAAADRAVLLSPSDAETHAARGGVLQRTGEYAQAVAECRRAVQLRPRDYYLWMLLGVTEDLNGDPDAALDALRQSVSLAPTYARPRWQLGNVLLRAGQTGQAFAELGRAATGNPELLPNVIDLAWGIYQGDVNAVLSAVPLQTDAARLEFAIFLARHKQSTAAADQFVSVQDASSSRSEALLSELLTTRAFGDAYRVWARMRGVSATDAVGAIRNGGFEDPLTVGETGFGWQIVPDVAGVAMSIDNAAHQSGAGSLRVDFHGNSNPQSPLLTQIILVKPQTHYRLELAALTKDFVSAADPAITLTDASDPKNPVLAQSAPLRSDANVWRDFAIDFTTNANTQAITITLARQSCTNNPCPAVGTVWLDSVSLESR